MATMAYILWIHSGVVSHRANAVARTLKQNQQNNVQDLETYRPVLAKLDPAMTWYKARSLLAKKMCHVEFESSHITI
jgi:hypothetical protein